MEIYTLFIVAHVIGAVIGVGTVTIHDLHLLRAIGDRDLAVAFQKSAVFYGKLIQTGLALLVLSGLYFMFSRPVLWSSEKILTKLALVGLLVINGAVINFVLHPKMMRLQSEDWGKKTTILKRLIFSRLPFDAISISAWYTILFLGAVGRQAWEPLQISIGYFLFLVAVYLTIWVAARYRLAK